VETENEGKKVEPEEASAATVKEEEQQHEKPQEELLSASCTMIVTKEEDVLKGIQLSKGESSRRRKSKPRKST